MPYIDPGAAAFQGIMNVLADRRAQQQQDFVNALAIQRERRAEQEAEYEHQDRQLVAQDRAQAARDAITERARQHEEAVVKDYAGRFEGGDVVPGDIDPGDLAILQKRGVVARDQPGAGIVSDLQIGTRPGALRFVKSIAQRKADDLRQKQLDYINSLPEGSAERKVAEFEFSMNRTAPAAMSAAPKPTTEGVFRTNGKTGTVEKIGDVPVGSHFVTEPQPPKEPNPQPQLFFDGQGNPHAIQFVNGQAREVALPAGIVGKQSPVSQTMLNKAVQANQVNSHVPKIKSLIEQANALGLIGPGGGRVSDFLAGKIGSTGDPKKDALLGDLRMEMSLFKSGLAMAHGGLRGGGSPSMVKRWDEVLDGSKMSADELIPAIEGGSEWLQTYGSDPRSYLPGAENKTDENNKPLTAEQALDLLKRRRGGAK